jgi:hypothetical protein
MPVPEPVPMMGVGRLNGRIVYRYSKAVPHPVSALSALSGQGRLRGRLKMAGVAPVDVVETPWALVWVRTVAQGYGHEKHRPVTYHMVPCWEYRESRAQAQALAIAMGLKASEVIGIVDVTRTVKRRDAVAELLDKIGAASGDGDDDDLLRKPERARTNNTIARRGRPQPLAHTWRND